MSVAVLNNGTVEVDSLIVVAAAAGKELARVAAPAWGFRSGAASVGCSVGIAEFDDIIIEQSAPQG
jgi:hypothetical protein